LKRCEGLPESEKLAEGDTLELWATSEGANVDRQFGTLSVTPTAVLSGVYKLSHLQSA
jgi:hypothetical protein